MRFVFAFGSFWNRPVTETWKPSLPGAAGLVVPDGLMYKIVARNVFGPFDSVYFAVIGRFSGTFDVSLLKVAKECAR